MKKKDEEHNERSKWTYEHIQSNSINKPRDIETIGQANSKIFFSVYIPHIVTK